MSIEEFKKEEPTEREKNYLRMRSIMDFGMGFLWMALGVFLFFIKYFSYDLALKYDSPVIKVFAVVCVIYGAWRLYRGYQKNYLKDR